MTLPRILVVDDQYARQQTERRLFLRHTGICEIGASHQDSADPVAEAVFCSGQDNSTPGRLLNSLPIVIKAITELDPASLALIMLDMRFDSGPLNQSGEPRGAQGDDEFGEILRSRISSHFSEIPLVVLTGKRHAELAQREIVYLSKERIDRYAIVSCLLQYGRLTPGQTRTLLGLNPKIIAESPASLAVFRQAWLAARTDEPVLILGETGVGKEIIASTIHEFSDHRTRRLVAVNCAAIPENLVESVLFGHEKGAFTSASSRQVGKFVEASGSSLFLDELGELPLQTQVKLLRAIDPGEVEPIGGQGPVTVDVRLISATNRNLATEVALGRFREDLYYRVAAATIVMPPLRERREDIAPLANAFLLEVAGAGEKSGITFSPEALQRLEAYDFPGNVRQLDRQIVKRLASAAGRNQMILARDVEQVLAGLPKLVGPPLSQIAPEHSKAPSESNTRESGERAAVPARQKLRGALIGVHGRQAIDLVERGLDETRHLGKSRDRPLGELNPTAAMKLLLDRDGMSTAEAADAIKRIAKIAGEVDTDSSFARVLSWARSRRGGK